MSYSKQLTTDGQLDDAKVLDKMDELFKIHSSDAPTAKYAINTAFEFGRELIGFDKADAWKQKRKLNLQSNQSNEVTK